MDPSVLLYCQVYQLRETSINVTWGPFSNIDSLFKSHWGTGETVSSMHVISAPKMRFIAYSDILYIVTSYFTEHNNITISIYL